MSRHLILLLLLLSFSSWAAGPRDRPPADGGERFTELVELLSLSEAQQAPVQQALKEHHQLARELGRGDRAQRDELDTQLTVELAMLLDADQLQRWETFQQQRRPRKGEGRPPRDGGGRQGHSRPD